MHLPFFFEENLPVQDEFILSEDSSKHIVQVLRMHESDQLNLTNGKGEVLKAFIVIADKKKTAVKITGRTFFAQRSGKVSIAVSLIKNKNRFEWFLEKATEIGVSEISPLICRRTAKQHFHYERMKNILVSAMLQSQQSWLPLLHEPVKFEEKIKKSDHPNKFIAHCMEDPKNQLANEISGNHRSGNYQIQHGDQIILIGPEGDFTKNEIDLALQHNFIPVSLGKTRLRTETAALVAAVLLLNK
ncbi:MAG: RsmE family RNA methyltransferase [Ginsengibacter sp.]